MISVQKERVRAIPILIAIIAAQTLGLVMLIIVYLRIQTRIQTQSVQLTGLLANRSENFPAIRSPTIEESKIAIVKGIPAQAAFPKATTEMPGLMELLRDPELSPYFLHQIKSQFFGSYLELFQSLNLDSPKSEALRSLLAERFISSYEVVNLSRNGSALSVVAVLDENRLQKDAEIRELLGEESYKSYAEYEASLGVRNTLKQFTRPLAFSSDSLSPQQMNVLVSSIMASEPRAAGRGDYLTPTVQTPVTIDQIRAHAAAASLTEAQLRSIESEFSFRDRARQLQQKNDVRFQSYLKTWAEQTSGKK